MPTLPSLYSDNDVAGMVYGPGDDPDAILSEFMRRVLGEGWDVLGILQRRVDGATSKNRSVEFVLAPETDWVLPATSDARVVATSGRVSERLPELGRRLAAALVRKPDLIVLNRFGRAELENGGLIGVLSDALIEVVPVVIAVPEGLRDFWIDSTGGLAVLVAPDPDRLMRGPSGTDIPARKTLLTSARTGRDVGNDFRPTLTRCGLYPRRHTFFWYSGKSAPSVVSFQASKFARIVSSFL